MGLHLKHRPNNAKYNRLVTRNVTFDPAYCGRAPKEVWVGALEVISGPIFHRKANPPLI